jgi:hypothetical protein
VQSPPRGVFDDWQVNCKNFERQVKTGKQGETLDNFFVRPDGRGAEVTREMREMR